MGDRGRKAGPRRNDGVPFLAFATLVWLDEQRHRRDCVVCTVVVVVVAVVVVTVSVVVDAVHDDHPRLLDPFPRIERTNVPHRNDRPRPVVRMSGDMVAGKAGRRRVVARRRTSVLMPCGRWLGSMTGGLVPCGRWLGGLARRSGRSGCGWLAGLAGGSGWLGCVWRGLGGPCLLGRLRRTAVAAMSTVIAALWRGERRCAECRAGEPDECEFHEVVVHSAPSLSVCDLLSWFRASPSRPYTRQGNRRGSF